MVGHHDGVILASDIDEMMSVETFVRPSDDGGGTLDRSVYRRATILSSDVGERI